MRTWLVSTLLVGLCFSAFAQESTTAQAQVLLSSGRYVAPAVVDLVIPPGATVSYRFLDSPGTTTFPWGGPISLDALAGETRSYALRITTELPSGESATKDYRYQVFRAVAPTATIQPEPGRYWTAVTVRPELPPGWKLFEDGQPRTYPRILDTLPGRARTWSLEARGPLGESFQWTYTVDRRDQEAADLEIVSPREGNWANAQALVVAFRGVDRVVWSYGSVLDPESAREYTGPMVLDRTGTQVVTVAARSRLDGHWIGRTVGWDSGSSPSPAEGWPASGVRTSGLTLPAVPGASLSWDEGRSWRPSSVVTEATSTSARKILSVQVKTSGVPSRYVYWLDGRAPDGPTVEFSGGWNPKISFSGSVEASHRVTWTRADGTAVDAPGLLWGPVGTWKVPDGVVAARVQVIGVNGVTGPSATFGFPETGWSMPVWEPWDQRGPQADNTVLPLGGRVLARPGFWPVYEVSSQPDVTEPHSKSPLLTGAFLPSFPWGSDRTLYVRFAWRDAAGLTGPSTAAVPVRVDRVPPAAPEIVILGGQIVVKSSEGEEEGGSLLWSATTARLETPGPLSFQPYKGPLDSATVRPSPSAKVWLHAQAIDRAGNSGPLRLNVALPQTLSDGDAAVVQVDPDPAVGESLVENGGVYPWTAFRLRALDQTKELWVGVSDQTSVTPSDWKTRLQPWTSILSRSVARGERRSFLVFWNAKTPSGWAWAQPKSVILTLDQGPPAAPVLSGTWPKQALGTAWTLELHPGRQGDILRYSYTLDGSEPADPAAGEVWPGSRTWDAPAGGRLEVRVRMAATSVSGIAVEAVLGGSVIVNREVPAALAPTLEPFTYRAAPFSVALPSGNAIVHYSLTDDGRLPDVPTNASPVVDPSGLRLEGKAGQSVLYRFRWRPYSESGIPGPVTDAYGVVIDRTAAAMAVAASGDGDLRAPSLRVTGLPESGVSSAPLTLRVDWPTGVVRYEVREGLGAPRPVGPGSAILEQGLILDGGTGVDRSFGVSFRGYSADGRPLTDETTINVRVDRSAPASPVLELVGDPRRPEATLTNRDQTHSAEESLSYRWVWTSFDGEKGASEWLSMGSDPAVFTAPGGNVTQLRAEAYLRDEAGNAGPIGFRDILIDQNAVYVASQGSGDGSRQAPLGSVTEAVARAHREGKAILLVAAGTYSVSRTLDLGGLRVYGGLTVASWETTTEPQRSTWTAAGPFQGASFIETESRSWSLSNVDLSSAASLKQVVLVTGADIVVKNSNWTWAASGRGWLQDGGSIDWTNVTVAYTAEPLGSFLDVRSAEVGVRNFNLTTSQNQGGVLVTLKGCRALFQELLVISKKAQGFDGVCTATDSLVTVDRARILAGDGADRVSAFVLRNSDVALWNTEVSLYGSLSNTGYQVTGGKLEIQKGTLSLLKGREFNQGLVLDQVQTVIRTWELKVESGSYQGGLTVDGGKLTMAAAKLRLAGGGQRAWGAQFLSPVQVTLNDVNWVLVTKTTGDLWKLDAPWSAGSTAVGSVASGW